MNWNKYNDFEYANDGLVIYIKNPDGVITGYIPDTPFVVEGEDPEDIRIQLYATLKMFFQNWNTINQK